jgi:hypothetical protein
MGTPGSDPADEPARERAPGNRLGSVLVVGLLTVLALGACGGEVAGAATATAIAGVGTGTGGRTSLTGGTPALTGGIATGGRAGGGTNATGGASTGGVATGGTGAGCGVPAQSAPPYTITLRFSNPGTSPLWLWIDCLLDFELTSCGDQYTASLPFSGGCSVECSDTGGCILCELCLPASRLVPAGGYFEFAWGGQTYTFGTTTQGCSCHVAHDAPAGLYRVSVPVWTTDPIGADAGWLPPEPSPDFTATRDFTLDRAGPVVVVDLVPTG